MRGQQGGDGSGDDGQHGVGKGGGRNFCSLMGGGGFFFKTQCKPGHSNLQSDGSHPDFKLDSLTSAAIGSTSFLLHFLYSRQLTRA